MCTVVPHIFSLYDLYDIDMTNDIENSFVYLITMGIASLMKHANMFPTICKVKLFASFFLNCKNSSQTGVTRKYHGINFL